MPKVSGYIWLIPGTPGTLPGTQKRPCGAAFSNMYPVYPEKMHFSYAREKNFSNPFLTQIKFRAYIRSKLPGTPGTPGTNGRNGLLKRVFLYPVLYPDYALSPVFERVGAQ